MKQIGLCFCLSIIFAALLCGCGSEQKNLPSSTEQNEVFSSAGKQAEPESTESQDVTETVLEIPQTSPPAIKEPEIESTVPPEKKAEPTKTEIKQPQKSENKPQEKTDAPKAPATPEPPTKTETPTEPVKPKTAYDYVFDIEAIRSDLIAVGQSMGLTHITSDNGTEITPSNSSWATPVTASSRFRGKTSNGNSRTMCNLCRVFFPLTAAQQSNISRYILNRLTAAVTGYIFCTESVNPHTLC